MDTSIIRKRLREVSVFEREVIIRSYNLVDGSEQRNALLCDGLYIGSLV